ncbi:hypothetical protein GCM10022209_59290 [Chitinophaga oryziterrae]
MNTAPIKIKNASTCTAPDNNVINNIIKKNPEKNKLILVSALNILKLNVMQFRFNTLQTY